MKPTSPVSVKRSPSPLCGLLVLLLLAAAPAWGQVVINEIDYDQPSTDTAEFVELKNVGAAAVNLGGYVLELVNGSGGGAVIYNTVALPAVSLAAGDYFVVCANAATVANCDLDASPNTDFIQNGSPDAVGLRLSGTLVDAVSYEGNSGAPYTEGSGSGLEDSFSAAGVGISRCPDGTDTNQNNVDLSLQAITPGAANDCPGPQLVINEIDYDQPGTDAAEFVEIKNVGASAVNLGGINLELVNGASGGAAIYDTIALPAVSLAAGDYFVVCANAATVANCDLDDFPDTNFIQNGAPDAVALVQGATILDTVSYEGNTVAPFTEGSGVGLEDNGASATEGISRCPDGVDTDQNNVDLALRPITPGAVNACVDPGGGDLVINEIDYDQPGTDAGEFVEIKNVGSAAASLSGVDLVLVNGAAGGAVIYNTIALPAVTLAAGDYFVVCGNAANVVDCDFDVTPDTDLVQNGSPDAVALRFAGVILDTVSYEGNTGAPFTEGVGTSAADSNDAGQDFRGISRFPDGADTNVNNADFVFSCITPGGANTDRVTGCTPDGVAFEIWEIQGSGLASPLAGSTVKSVANVVTCLATNGFFMQTPASRTDGVLATSDGIFVFTGSAPTVAVGDLVDVRGVVVEFFGLTQFTSATVTVTGTGIVPSAVVFDAFTPSPDPTAPSCGAFEFECYESMLVDVPFGTVAASNQQFSSDPFAEIHIVAGAGRVFREPGVEHPGLGGTIPTWDGNPEAFELDPNKLGLVNQVIPAGSTFSAKGVIGFEFNHYELWPNELTVNPAPLPVPVRAVGPNELTVGSLNMFRLFDDVNDPPSVNTVGATRDDTVVSLAEYLRRRAKLATYVVEVLRSPAILAVQEVEKLEALQDLAGDVNALDPSVSYTSFLLEGNDVGTIDVGFMVRSNVQVTSVTQIGLNDVFTFDVPPSALHDRPPLLIEAICDGTFPISVIVVHMRSLGGIETERVQRKRLEQAEALAQKIQDLQNADPAINLVVTGDFNAFEFTDGFVDLAGIVKGDFDPAESSICNVVPCADLVSPDLTDQVLNIPAEERYSFIFRDSFNPVRSRGDAQILDHAMTSQHLDSLVTGYEYGRGNADAAEALVADDGSADPSLLPLRSSDHDGLVLYVLKDEDQDGVPDADDVCLGTSIPEGVPTQSLGVNRYALVDGDGVFDTTPPPGGGGGPGLTFTIEDTAGCSCEQIILAQGLGSGHTKFGCSIGEMQNWVALVNP